jgi:hypothetical protein
MIMEKDVLYPRNFVETASVDPKTEDRAAVINAFRVAVKAMLGTFVRPTDYATVIDKVVANFPLRSYEAESLVREVDAEWHPEKFEAKEAEGAEGEVIK